MFDRKIEEMIEQVQKPARYIGGEMNTAVKAWEDAEVHFAFCFPDTYEVAMSHLGMKILYAIINAQPWALCGFPAKTAAHRSAPSILSYRSKAYTRARTAPKAGR